MALPMRGTILCVDDDRDSASMLAEILTLRGFATSWVTSAEECLHELTAVAVDVVVTDVRMAGISGIELCGILRDRHPHVVNIVVTGDLARNRAHEAMQAGAYQVLGKPIRIAELDSVLTKAASLAQLRRAILTPALTSEDGGASAPMDALATATRAR